MFDYTTPCSTNSITTTSTDLFEFAGSTLPTIPTGYGSAHIELDVTAGDIDLTSWSSGADIGAWIRVRKSDSSSNKITYSDGSTTYKFVSSKDEFMTFQVTSEGLAIR